MLLGAGPAGQLARAGRRLTGTSSSAAPNASGGAGTYSQSEVDRYDEELDRGGQELIEDLRALTRANMEDEAERFAGALASDSILPEDF